MAESGQSCTQACSPVLCDEFQTQNLADLEDTTKCQAALKEAGDPDWDLQISLWGPPHHQEDKFTGGCGSTIDERTPDLYRWNNIATSDVSCDAPPSSWSGRRICVCEKGTFLFSA